MKKEITLKFIAHNGSTILREEEIDFLPGIGTAFKDDSLRDSSCTGLFIVVDSSCIVKDGKYLCLIDALETNEEIYKQGLQEFVLQLTS
ncbi:hypothetical protein CRV02_01030 [Arcobacter sp. CECT 8989]|uniref:hypothetical protein n=1 Tax=Arcobacter sp. CECT 8989 TaxID=2044509 RepID=UPI00100B8439|nr:hypothetical protein [Arcobacter sp. CECT 8989]RXK03809.1 hypothetical protein CRV02_01030 [Arcobacter sp. CECT 8989]